MVKESGIERRVSVRAKRILSIRHRLHKRNGKIFSDEPWYLSTTENMSASGVLFVSAAKYAAGDIVELHIVMSGILDIFRGYGEVVRTEQKPEAAFYMIAVSYTSLKPRKRKIQDIPKSRRRIPLTHTSKRK